MLLLVSVKEYVTIDLAGVYGMCDDNVVGRNGWLTG